MFPLSTVLYPHAWLSLHVFEERYRRLMADCLEGDGTFGVVLITRGSEVGGGDHRAGVGTIAQITEVARLDDGRMLIQARGTTRIVVDEWLGESPYPHASVRDFAPDEEEAQAEHGRPDGEAVARSLATAEHAVRRLCSLLSELGAVPALPHDLAFDDGPGDQAGWRLCTVAPLNLLDRQHLLACADLVDRMELLCELSTALGDDAAGLLAGGLEA
jgi:Lon protease-like protein